METWLLSLFHLTGLVSIEEAISLDFESPIWLWLILIWPIFWWLSHWLGRDVSGKNDLSEMAANRQLRVKHALIHRAQKSSVSVMVQGYSLRSVVLNLLRGLMIGLLALALAEPVLKLPKPVEPESKTVRDIVFVIESSASFLLPDYEMNGQPETRMNVVKEVLDSFIAQLEGNRFGLAIYADSAFTLLPLTHDQTLARLSLKKLQPYLAGRTDTAMGEALGLALKQTDYANVSLNKTSKDKVSADNAFIKANANTLKRVLVLISDGLSQPSKIELTEAVNYAQLLQVPIYTIGVGASSEQADKRLYTGLLFQPLESESLQQIAQQTGGQYFQVGSGAEISTVLNQINQTEGVPYQAPPALPQKQALFFYPLLAGLVIFCLYWLLSVIWINISFTKPKATTKNNLSEKAL